MSGRTNTPAQYLVKPVDCAAGGEGGIRTPDTLSGMPVFKTGAINHSATSPMFPIEYKREALDAQRLSRTVSTTHASLHEDGRKCCTGVSLQQRTQPKSRDPGNPFYFERPKAREWNCMISPKCARK